MSENEIPFLKELRTELRRAAHAQTANTAQLRRPTRRWGLAGIPVLVALGAVAYFVLAGGPAGVPKVPVVGFSGQATAAAAEPPVGTRVIGNKECIKMASGGGHLPRLIRSAAAPDKGLLDELSMLRGASTPLDKTSLGKWDRYPLLIGTVFERYVRVVNGPRHVRLAFLPVTYCTQSQVEPSGPKAPGGVFRQTLEQGLVMLVLSNNEEHPPVLVGSAQKIKRGPALAGLGIESAQGTAKGWLQAIVVPDGVSKVVMKFTPPFLHHYSNALQIQSNVGIVVRRPPYTPTTVLWYGANGRLIKKFVDHGQIAEDKCLAAHKKTCGLTGSAHDAPIPAVYAVASNKKQAGSPALIAQANALYQPVKAYEQSITAAQSASANAAKARVGKAINRCDAPYRHQLFKVRVGTTKYKLYSLWNDVSSLQQYEVGVGSTAPQLRSLASSWTALSLKNPAMSKFAHGTAAELIATLNAAPINACSFVRAVAAHHFSYAWARNSTYGVEASAWHNTTLKDANQASAFWRYVQPATVYANTSDIVRAGGPGWRLFTVTQTRALANLPGEAG